MAVLPAPGAGGVFGYPGSLLRSPQLEPELFSATGLLTKPTKPNCAWLLFGHPPGLAYT